MSIEPVDTANTADLEKRLEEARRLLDEEQFQDALILCKGITSDYGMNAASLMLEGIAQSQLWNFSSAISCMESAITLRPDFAEAYYHLGKTWALLNNHEKAAHHLREAIRIKPDFTSAMLRLAECYKVLGQPALAVECYENALARHPDNPKAWTSLAETQQILGNTGAARNSYHKALEIKPDLPEVHYHLGLISQDEKRLAAAEQEFQAELLNNPHHARSLINLSKIQRTRNDLPAALATLRQTIAYHPDRADLRYNCGILLIDMKQYEDAEKCFRDALAIKPGYGIAHTRLGDLCRLSGDGDNAKRHYRKSIELGSEDTEYAHYMLAALGDSIVPASTPAGYVRDQFDNYAERFDKHLVEELGYRTPEHLFDEVCLALGKAPGGYDVMDLGCGTGLCGPLFRDVAKHITGIDLSPGMIAKARARKVYDELHTGDIGDFLGITERKYDIIIAADVFVYIGDLEEIFRTCHHALAKGGYFAFSTETSHNGTTYTLNPSGRYAHAPGYIQDLARAASFRILRSRAVILRQENNKPVNGQIFVMQVEDRK